MTDAELEELFRHKRGETQVAALRAIYQQGFDDGVASTRPEEFEVDSEPTPEPEAEPDPEQTQSFKGWGGSGVPKRKTRHAAKKR